MEGEGALGGFLPLTSTLPTRDLLSLPGPAASNGLHLWRDLLWYTAVIWWGWGGVTALQSEETVGEATAWVTQQVCTVTIHSRLSDPNMQDALGLHLLLLDQALEDFGELDRGKPSGHGWRHEALLTFSELQG